jgi:hypothetical protein
LGSVKDETMFRGRSGSFKFLYQKRSGEPEQSEPKMNNSPCSSRGQRQGAAIARYVPGHGLHHDDPDSEGKSLSVMVTPVGDYMDRIRVLGLVTSGLWQSELRPRRWGNAQAVTPADKIMTVQSPERNPALFP